MLGLMTDMAFSSQKMRVVASTAFIGTAMQDILGDTAHVTTLMGEGTDPHLYRPRRDDMATLMAADVILWTGADLEAQLARPIRALEKTQKLILTLMDFVPEEERLNAKGKSADPHIWMDPVLWSNVIGTSIDAIIDHAPLHAPTYRQRLTMFQQRLAVLDQQIHTLISTIPHNARILITAHDAFGYFGRRYGMRVEGIQGMSTESEAGLQRIASLIDLIIEKRVPAIFAEASVSPRHINALIEGARMRDYPLQQGGKLFADSMGHPASPEGTFNGMMLHNVVTISKALNSTHLVQTIPKPPLP